MAWRPGQSKKQSVFSAGACAGNFLCLRRGVYGVRASLRAYGAYFDWKVLSLLFCLMAVVAGLQECNVFAVFCQRLLTGRKRMGLLSLILVLLPFFASMLITNDVALITFVPFTIVVLSMIQRRQYLIYLIVLQTIAANLGSMAAPVGNPQSLFLMRNSICPPEAISG